MASNVMALTVVDEVEGSAIIRELDARSSALAEWLPDAEIPLRAAGLLGSWADSGIIVGIRL